MPDGDQIPFDYLGAKKEGYTDGEIMSFLKDKYNFEFDLVEAKKSGYSDKEIADYITAYEPPKKKGLGQVGTQALDITSLSGGAMGLNGNGQSDERKILTNAITQTHFKKNEHPFDQTKEEAIKGATTKLNDIMYGEGEDWKDPIKAAIKGINKSTNVKDAAEHLGVKTLTEQSLMPDGFEAKQTLASTILGKMGDDNLTSKVLREKANNYDKKVAPLNDIQANEDLSNASEDYLKYNFGGQINNAAIKYYADKHPEFKKELKISGIDINDPFLADRIPSGKRGQIKSEFFNDPDINTYLQKENPNLIPAFQVAEKNHLTDDIDYGINQVANKVSRARNDEGLNDPLINFYGDAAKEATNAVAESVLPPQELEIYNKHIRDHQEKYIDAPSLLSGVAKGIKNTLSSTGKLFTEPFTSESQSVKNQWEKEASNVSADPKGVLRFLNDTGEVLGFLTTLGATGNVTGLNPVNALTLATTGDIIQQSRENFRGEPVKAALSGFLNVGLYRLMGKDIFPVDKAKAAFDKAKPELDKIVENLTAGRITADAARKEASTTFGKMVDFAGGTLSQNAKITAELTGLQGINRIFDKISMDDATFKKLHPDDELAQGAKHTFLSFLTVAGLGKYGQMKNANNLVSESIYEAASKPNEYKRQAEDASKSLTYADVNEIKENIDYAAKIKQELDKKGISPKNQKRYLFEALQEKSRNDLNGETGEPTLDKIHKEAIKEHQEVKERILAGEDHENIVTEKEQKILDEQEKTKTELERLKIDNELDNKKVDAKIEGIDGRESEANRIKLQELKEEKRRINEDYEKSVAKLTPEEKPLSDTNEEPILKTEQPSTVLGKEVGSGKGEDLGDKGKGVTSPRYVKAQENIPTEENKGTSNSTQPSVEESPEKLQERYKRITDENDFIDPYDRAVKYFADGGRVNPSEMERIFGGKGDKAVRISLIKNNGGTVEQIAHHLWETDPSGKYDTQDYLNAIESALSDHSSKSAMQKDLADRYDYEAAQEKYLNQKYGQEAIDIVDKLTEDQMNEILRLDADEKTKQELENYINETISPTTEDTKSVLPKEEIPPTTNVIEESKGAATGEPPKEPPTEKTIDENDPEGTKMANAVNDAFLEGKFGTDALDRIISKLQDTDLENIYTSVKDRIKKGVLDVKKVREKLLTTKSGNEHDQAALLYDLAELKGRESNLINEINKEADPKKQKELQSQLLDVQNEIMDNGLANRYIGRSASTIFRLRQIWVNKEADITQMREQYKASKGLKELSPEQEKEVKDAYDKIRNLEVEKEKLKTELNKAIEDNAKLIVENERLEKLKSDAQNQKKKDRGQKSEEAIRKSQERIQKAKDNLKGLRGNLSAGFDPKIAIEISKIAAEKVYQGIVKIDELVRNVLDDIRDIFPTWTEEDVRSHLFPKANAEQYYKARTELDKSSKDLKLKVDEYKKLQKEYAIKMFEWQKDRRMDMMKDRPLKDRIIDSILRWQRFAVLSYPSTIAKLIAVVAHQITLKPLKFGIQYGISKLLPKSIKTKMGVWGEPTIKALGKYYSTLIKNFSLANLKEQFRGIDTKEIMYGDKFMYDEWVAAKGLLEMPGRSHGYIKSFIKNPEFQFAHEQLINANLKRMGEIENELKNPDLKGDEKKKLEDEYKRVDITNEDVMEGINSLSLEHGKWAILMNNNRFVDKFQKWTRDSGIPGAVIKSELPIVKIPTNYVGRFFAVKYGLIRAIAGRGKWEGKGNFPGIAELIIKGTKDLKPEQADLLGKALNLGVIGAGFFGLGYMGANKIKENDDGSYSIFGVRISKNFVHSPEIESILSGSKVRNQQVEKDKGFLGAMFKSDWEIVKKSPFVSMLQYGALANVARALFEKNEKKGWDIFQDAIYKKVIDMVIPGASKQLAGAMDTKSGFSINEKPIKRWPTGEGFDRFWHHLEMAIPGLRQNVHSYDTPFTKEDEKDPTFKYFSKDWDMELPNTSLQFEKVNGKTIADYPKEVQEKYTNTHKDFLKSELKSIKDWGSVYINSNGNVSLAPPDDVDYTKKSLDKLNTEGKAQVLKLAQSAATEKSKNEIFYHKTEAEKIKEEVIKSADPERIKYEIFKLKKQ